MNADTCTSDFMQLIEAKSIVVERQKMSVPVVTLSPHHSDGAWAGHTQEMQLGGCRPAMLEVGGIVRSVSGCSSASLARKG